MWVNAHGACCEGGEGLKGGRDHKQRRTETKKNTTDRGENRGTNRRVFQTGLTEIVHKYAQDKIRRGHNLCSKKSRFLSKKLLMLLFSFWPKI